MIDARRLFEVIRDIKGGPLTQADVDRVNAVLTEAAAPNGGTDYVGLLAHVAGRPADGTIRSMAGALGAHAAAYGMTTPPRLAEFVAQIANETGGFTTFSENLNYSPQGLSNTWARFSASGKRGGPPNTRAMTIGRTPQHPANKEAIANEAYGGRMGNTQPGDGYRYRGRGALQLTGRDNYTRYGQELGVDLVGSPDLAADPATSVLTALQFFKNGNVNAAVDRGDYREARRITNGGDIGLEEVAKLRAKAMEFLT